METEPLFASWADVSLQAIRNNIRRLQASSQSPIMAVVKANAYGHGLLPVACAALEAGAAWCGVAQVDEALALRQAGLECPILVMGYTPPGKLETTIANSISLTIWDLAQIPRIASAAAAAGKTAHLHVKIDSGMNRLGIQPGEALDLIHTIQKTKGLQIEGIFTHFARADEPDSPSNRQQEEIFTRLLDDLEAEKALPTWIHSANSAAGLTRISPYTNLVRAGVAMYGLHPSQACSLPTGFQPALSWHTLISHIKTLPPGQGISYGHTYITQKTERIGTLPVGYADGFRRIDGNMVLVQGERVPVVGRVCMDQIMVQLDKVPNARPGDEVVLLGAQNGTILSAEEIALRWGTINYEVVCAIGPRVLRRYI